MSGAGAVALAAGAFVGTHFVLSHPLRAPLVWRIGEGAFLGVYSLVSAVTLGWMVLAYRAVPLEARWWTAGDGLWAVVTAAMLLASILLVGSLRGNPALPDPRDGTRPAPEPHGVFRITRHPMLWSFAIWGMCHIAVLPTPSNIVLAGAILLLSLVGAGLQDRKKEQLQPARWRAWEARTSFWPFARGAAWPGWGVALGGVALWLAATWAHGPLAGWAAGIWRWV